MENETAGNETKEMLRHTVKQATSRLFPSLVIPTFDDSPSQPNGENEDENEESFVNNETEKDKELRHLQVKMKLTRAGVCKNIHHAVVELSALKVSRMASREKFVAQTKISEEAVKVQMVKDNEAFALDAVDSEFDPREDNLPEEESTSRPKGVQYMSPVQQRNLMHAHTSHNQSPLKSHFLSGTKRADLMDAMGRCVRRRRRCC